MTSLLGFFYRTKTNKGEILKLTNKNHNIKCVQFGINEVGMRENGSGGLLPFMTGPLAELGKNCTAHEALAAFSSCFCIFL